MSINKDKFCYSATYITRLVSKICEKWAAALYNLGSGSYLA